MRIMHVLLSRGFAGTERATAEMCNAHSAEHDVTVVLKRGQRRHGAGIRDYLDPRVAVFEVGDWWPAPALKRVIAQCRPEIVHAHLRRATRLVTRIRPDCPTVATLHLWVNGAHFLAMDGLIVIAQWQKRDLESYRGHIFDINESLVPHRRLSAEQVVALRAELGAGPNDFLIGGVGRLARSKGFDLLIQAFKRAALPHAKLVIVGDGRERRPLERLSDGQVRFTGFRDDVKDCYQALDLFVSPSRSEPLGRVVLEALDGGAPVLATATRGPCEILSRYPGRLIPVEDGEAMCRALTELVRAPPKRIRPDLSAYHIDSVAQKTLSAYRTLTAGRTAPARSASYPGEGRTHRA